MAPEIPAADGDRHETPSYERSPGAHLERAQALLDTGRHSDVLYAALELRFGVEARLKEYLIPQDVPKSHKEEWAINKLSRSLESVLGAGDGIFLVFVTQPRTGASFRLLYTPVSSRLQEIVKRLGDPLHFPRSRAAESPEWWGEQRAIIEEGCNLLRLANSGEILGFPAKDYAEGKANIRVILGEDDPRRAMWQSFQAQSVPPDIKVVEIKMAGPPTFYNE